MKTFLSLLSLLSLAGLLMTTGCAVEERGRGGYYGPGGRFKLVGPTVTARVPRRARDAATAARLWAEAERLTKVSLPTAVTSRQNERAN